MAKSLYFYNDPNDPASNVVRAAVSTCGVAFTELNLASDFRKHNVTRPGPMVLIDIDGKVYQELPVGVTNTEIAAAWNAAPATMPAVLESAVVSATIIQRPLPLSKPSDAPTNRELMEALIKIYDAIDELKRG